MEEGAAAVRLAHLSVRDFRNLASVELSPPAEGLVLVGENGQGKTNLLEAIYYLQIFRSVRGAPDTDLVRFGATGFHLGASVENDRRREIGVGFERQPGGRRKRVRVDGVVTERLSSAIGVLPSVLFSPSDVELIAGSATSRRKFLDIMLALTVPGYLAALQGYRAALVRRNAALRAAGRSGTGGAAGASLVSQIAVWEPALARHGSVVVRARRCWVESVGESFGELCRQLGETGAVHLGYVGTAAGADDPAEAISAAAEAHRWNDIRRGRTHDGPHRDDLRVTIAGLDGAQRELRNFGSAGQQRSAAIALRMLEASTLKASLGRSPVFLLDDPLAELDARRSGRVLELLAQAGWAGHGGGQSILAAPRESDIPPEFLGFERMRVASGEVRRVAAA